MKELTMFGLPVEGAAIKHILRKNPHNIICDDQEFLPEEGLKKIIMNQPDLLLVLLDGMESTAFSFMGQVREKTRHTDMIVISSEDNFDFLQKSVRIGCCDYLLKPCNAKVLNEAVDRVIEKRKSMSLNFTEEQEDNRQLKQELINEILYSDEGRPGYTAGAWLEAVYAADGDHAIQEMIDFTFTLKNLLELDFREFMEHDAEQKKVIQEINLNLISGLYDSRSQEEACRAFTDYTEKLAKICRTDSLSNSYRLVEMSRKVIEQRMDQKLSLEMVANEIYISPFYLCRIFKKHTGGNFSDYVIETKIREAKRLLLSSGETIDEIAHKVGYDEPNSFRRMFKKRVGVSPGNYRSRAANSPLTGQDN